MRATVTLEIENAAELVAIGQALNNLGAYRDPTTSTSSPIPAEAPADKPAIAAPQGGTKAATKAEIATAKKAAAAAEAAAKAEADAADEFDVGLDDEGDDQVVQEVTKAMVAVELRAFINKKGESGPKEAMAELKKFGASRFDDLKEGDYVKFLTALGKAA